MSMEVEDYQADLRAALTELARAGDTLGSALCQLKRGLVVHGEREDIAAYLNRIEGWLADLDRSVVKLRSHSHEPASIVIPHFARRRQQSRDQQKASNRI